MLRYHARMSRSAASFALGSCNAPRKARFVRTALAAIITSAMLAACSIPKVDDNSRTQSRVPPRSASGAFTTSPQGQQCLAELGATGAQFTPLPDRYPAAGCSQINTVQLQRLPGDNGAFAATNLGPVACPLASAFTAWARFGVDRAARQILGAPLASIETYGSYSCRNIAGSNRRSAHATSEAIDVSAFVLADGRRISVAQDWRGDEGEREFLRVIHRSACKRFGTVLGPDYDSAHADHFHLEKVIDGRSFCR